MTQEEIKGLIEKQAKEFFSISKNDENYTTKLDIAKTKLVISIWKYCKKYRFANKDKSGFSKTDKYSMEICKTIEACINSFDSSKGKSFLALFETFVKKEFAKAEKEESLRGLKLPTQATKDLKFLKRYERDIYDREKVFAAGRKLGWSNERIQKAFDLTKIKTIDEIGLSFEGNEISNFDNAIAQKYFTDETLQKEDEITYEKLKLIVEKTECEFKKLQERTKKYISALLTYYFSCYLLKLDTGEIAKLSFVDKNILEEIQRNPKLKQQDVAEKFGRDKTDASRTLKNFLRKI